MPVEPRAIEERVSCFFEQIRRGSPRLRQTVRARQLANRLRRIRAGHAAVGKRVEKRRDTIDETVAQLSEIVTADFEGRAARRTFESSGPARKGQVLFRPSVHSFRSHVSAPAAPQGELSPAVRLTGSIKAAGKV